MTSPNRKKKWRVDWLVGTRFQYRYYDDDYKAIKKHIENLRKYGLGSRLNFRAPKAGQLGVQLNYLVVGGTDSLLGLTSPPTFLGKPREYWARLVKKAIEEVVKND